MANYFALRKGQIVKHQTGFEAEILEISSRTNIKLKITKEAQGSFYDVGDIYTADSDYITEIISHGFVVGGKRVDAGTTVLHSKGFIGDVEYVSQSEVGIRITDEGTQSDYEVGYLYKASHSYVERVLDQDELIKQEKAALESKVAELEAKVAELESENESEYISVKFPDGLQFDGSLRNFNNVLDILTKLTNRK